MLRALQIIIFLYNLEWEDENQLRHFTEQYAEVCCVAIAPYGPSTAVRMAVLSALRASRLIRYPWPVFIYPS